MNKYLIFSLLLTTFASLNAPSAIAAPKITNTSADQQAQLVIFRTVKHGKNHGINYRLLLDGQQVGKLTADKIIQLQLKPGEHIIQSNDRYHSSLTVNLKPGQTLFVNGSIDRHFRLNMVEAEPTTAVLEQISAETSIATRH